MVKKYISSAPLRRLKPIQSPTIPPNKPTRSCLQSEIKLLPGIGSTHLPPIKLRLGELGHPKTAKVDVEESHLLDLVFYRLFNTAGGPAVRCPHKFSLLQKSYIGSQLSSGGPSIFLSQSDCGTFLKVSWKRDLLFVEEGKPNQTLMNFWYSLKNATLIGGSVLFPFRSKLSQKKLPLSSKGAQET